VSVINESVTFTSGNAIQKLSASTQANVICGGLTYVANGTTTGASVKPANFTRTDCTVINATAIFPIAVTNTYWNASYVQLMSYTYLYTTPDIPSAYNAINGTENAGYGLVSYLPLIFLAIIFGAILTLVLKIILPFINLGQQASQF
jgi:hypothetical protein